MSTDGLIAAAIVAVVFFVAGPFLMWDASRRAKRDAEAQWDDWMRRLGRKHQ